jgi:hypothetical protein
VTVLLTLPQMRRDALEGTLAAGEPVRLGVSAHTRALAAQRLAHALARGRVSVKQARAAMLQGDVAVASLLRGRMKTPPAPEITDETFADLPHGGALAEPLRERLIVLARQLSKDGDLSAQSLATLASGRPDDVAFLEHLSKAWHRRCARIARAVLPQIEPDAYACFAITPVVLEQAICAISMTGAGTHTAIDPSEIDANGVLVELGNWPMVRLPAHPVDEPDFFRAFVSVWNALAQACQPVAMLWQFDTDLIHLAGVYAEAFEDAIAMATWEGNTATLAPASIQMLRDEFGFEDFDELTPLLARYRDWKKAVQVDPCPIESEAFSQFLATRATPSQAALLRTLCALVDAAKAQRPLPNKSVERTCGGDGVNEVVLLPRDFGIDDYILPCVDSMYDSGETPVTQFAPKDVRNPNQFWRLADHVIVSAVIATAALNEVGNYVSN